MISALIVPSSRLSGTLLAECLQQEVGFFPVDVANVDFESQKLDSTYDVVIVEHPESAARGLEIVDRLKRQTEAAIVVAGVPTTQSEGRASITSRYFEYGAVGYVTTDDTCEHIVEVVNNAVQGHARIDPPVAAELVRRLAELRRALDQVEIPVLSSAEMLTRRQEEVLALMAEGMTNQQIADQLFIEVGTVKNHVHNILDKFNVSNREQAASCYQILRAEPVLA